MSPCVLRTENLTKIFDQDLLKKKQLALDQVSVRFLKGQCTGFLGHNGAGKTTTIRIIFGLCRPNRGRILFNERPIEQKDRALMGYMPEINKLPLNLNALEILHTHLEIYPSPYKSKHDRKQAILEKLQEVGLYDHRNKKLKELSKGMARRVAWAKATIHKPELVILDEPLSGLDPLGRKYMIDWIKQLKHSGTSIVFCTHELQSMHALCDHFHILKKGKLAYSTLDPLTHQTESSQTQQHWSLTLSGLDLTEAQTIVKEKGLREFKTSYSQGHKLKLQFHDYSSAKDWLELAIKESYVILSFDTHRGLAEEQILPFFDGSQDA